MVMILEDNGFRRKIQNFFSHPRNLVSVSVLVLVAVALPITGVLISRSQDLQQRAAEPTTTYGQKIKEITNSVSTRTLTFDPLTSNDKDNYGYLGGLICVPDFKLAEYYASTDPTRAAQHKARGVKIASYLVDHKDDNQDGKVGWGYKDPIALDNGQTAPANTVDAYQTGHAVNCLMEAYKSTLDQKYYQAASEAFNNYLPYNSSNFDPQCSNCMYFWPLLTESMKDRKIKNRNMLLGMGFAKLALYDRRGEVKNYVNKVLNAENYEFSTRNNYGFTSFNDPMYWYYNFPEDHIQYDMWGLDEILRTFGIPANIPQLQNVWNQFIACGDSCFAGENSDTRLFISCQLTPYGEPFKSDCKRLIQYYSNFPDKITMLSLSGMIRANTVLQNEPYISGASPTPTPVPNYSILPLPVSNVHTGIVTSSAIQVVWDNTTNNERKFVVEYTPVNGSTYKSLDVAENWSSKFISGLPSGTSFKIRVKACNDAGCSAPTSDIVASTSLQFGVSPTMTQTPTPTIVLGSNVAPNKPTVLTVSPILDTAVTINWVSSSNNETSYTFAYTVNTTPQQWKTLTVLDGSLRTYTFTGLTPGTPYYFGVSGCNSVGCSAYATTASITTLVSAPTSTSTPTPTSTPTLTPTPYPTNTPTITSMPGRRR